MDERLPYLLSGNFALDHTELKAVEHAITTRVHAINKLELELQAYRALISPLRRNAIPPEVLSQVFVLALDDPETTKRDRLNDICLVCKAWREVALGTPELWTHLDKISLNGTPPNMNKIRSWLARSLDYPKTLEIAGIGYKKDHQPNTCLSMSSPALATFLTSGPTLNNLVLACSYQCIEALVGLIKPTRSSFSPSWDALRSLELRMGHYSEHLSQPSWHALYNLPPLTSLTLELPRYNDIPELHSLPEYLTLPDLTNLTLICDWPYPWIAGTLENCRTLQSLAVNLNEDVPEHRRIHYNFNDPVLLPNLRILRLQRITPEAEARDAQFLRFFMMPSLEELDLCFLPDEPGDGELEWDFSTASEYTYSTMHNLHAYMGFDGSTNLKRLRIQSLHISSYGLLKVLGRLASLTHLTLDAVATDPDFFFRISNSASLPSGTTVLEFYNVIPQNFRPDVACSTLVEERGRGGLQRLEKLTMTVRNGPRDPHSGRWATKLRESGVAVVDIAWA
ncbi:hypothetical protein DFP72DRAFT_60600 [Ephemerocybe angulata]|uniref:F-box domain-containing protein n=1 Tax=Ephemerocybe angulata TaxID=980116 RepID=A0A8H6HDJ0_9AGAR|nr:hypothetical protein DFP72DRAFT_60600 [Tulosesus angulatus]